MTGGGARDGSDALPMEEGDVGEPVADLQRRLALVGFPVTTDDAGAFGPATRSALEAFQHRRGLRVDGICGRQSWATLVESGWVLGDRFLYRRTPMQRGDDVADLQQRLGSLGFDTGRVDGIFGDQTSKALAEFQRNAGLPVDGIVGVQTLEQLRRLQARHEGAEVVSTVRDRERLRRAPPTLSGRHLAIGETGDLAPAAAALQRRLVAAGARVSALHHPDDPVQADQANLAEVDAYLGLRLLARRSGCTTSYYAGYRYESAGGRRLAELIQHEVPPALGLPDLGALGMSLPLLRETRMPAVIVEVGPPRAVVERGPALATALVAALGSWAAADWG